MKLLNPSVLILTLLASCGPVTDSTSSTTGEANYSASSIALSMVGSALSGTIADGTLSFNSSFLAEACINPSTAFGDSSCNASSFSLWIRHLNCSFPGSTLLRTGSTLYLVSGANPQVAFCGTFPDAGLNGKLTRQYVSGLLSTAPAEMVRNNSSGQPTKVDDASLNIGNFDTSHSVAPLLNGGYGIELNFNSLATRSSLKILERQYVMGLYDHSVEGTLAISEAAGATTRVLNGTLQVYDNTQRVIGTALFTNVTHSNSCCTPVSGTVTTTFATGSIAPTATGAKMVGKTETLTITGCGTGTLVDTSEETTSVMFNQCI